MEPNKTKIMATIGPASNSPEILRKMFQAGLSVCRLNFSHGTHEEHLKVIKTIRKLNRELQTHVAILADLQGPKLRIGNVRDHQIDLKEGEKIQLVTRECLSTNEKLYVRYPELHRDVKPGDAILVDDGKIQLQVLSTNGTDCTEAKITHGGRLTSNKGVNLPQTIISQPSLTQKDLKDAAFAMEHDVDWIALSFVRSATDMADLWDFIRKKKKNIRMIAKIEKPEALDEIDNIIDVSHGIMIARGDLGVEVSFEKLPVIQKEIIKKCIDLAKPVIIATQMMESMVTNFRPTRAETTDVANAVLDGADCLMLSGETSVGQFPVEVVRSMQQIISFTEKTGLHYIREHAPTRSTPSFLPDTISYHASQMAELSQARAIITFTHSGYTSKRISSHRPHARIFAFTNNLRILNSLSILWGVQAKYVKTYENINEAISNTIDILKDEGTLRDGDVVVHLGSIPLNMKGQTNMMKISYV